MESISLLTMQWRKISDTFKIAFREYLGNVEQGITRHIFYLENFGGTLNLSCAPNV